jgi:hypothetical protein
MDVHVAFGLFFMLDLFSHGISGKNTNNILHCAILYHAWSASPYVYMKMSDLYF